MNVEHLPCPWLLRAQLRQEGAEFGRRRRVGGQGAAEPGAPFGVDVGHQLSVLEEPWDPPAGPFDRARPALIAADFPHFRPWRNRLSEPSLQLRFGRDGLWYGYESDRDREDWWPRGTPDTDPVGALTALLGR